MNYYPYQYNMGWAPPPPPPQYYIEGKALKKTSGYIGLFLLLFLAIGYGLPTQFSWLLGSLRYSPFGMRLDFELLNQILLLIISLLAIALPTGIYIACVGIPLKRAIPSRRLPVGTAAAAVPMLMGSWGVGAIAAGIINALLYGVGLTPQVPEITLPSGTAARWVFLTTVTVIPALFEEFAFRGAIMQSLRRFGDAFALLVSSAVFSLCHINLIRMPNAFICGLIIGYFVLITGSIWIGVLMHFINNSVSMGILYITQNYGLEKNAALMIAIYVCFFVLGALALLLLWIFKNGLPRPNLNRSILTAGSKCARLFSSITFIVALLAMLAVTASSSFMLQ
jgi:membrane protease YdiL (CAAX protease family)